ncbi:MAG: hypothetical protein H0V83_12295 [Rubrobacter sp.]|nr:hypothetical protein [Rubrobacter sp.]
MLGNAGAAIRGSVLGYLVVFSGPGAVPRVAGVAIADLAAPVAFLGFPVD